MYKYKIFWLMQKLKLPTDLKILKHIYLMYEDEFRKYEKGANTRECKTYVPINIKKIADELKTDPYVLFGRLYFHLNYKYGYEQKDGSKVFLFSPKVGEDPHCINYPYLAAIVSEKRSEWIINSSALIISLISVGIAFATLIYTIYRATGAPITP